MSRRKKKTARTTGAVLLTGASSGIGRELAICFARGGHDLILTARNEERLSQLATQLREEHGISTFHFSCDLAAPDAAEEVHRWVRRQGLSVDILVNNAGFDVYGEFAETDLSTELDMLQVNIIALTALTKKFLPRMLKRGRGRILNIGSTGSFIPAPLNAVYCASKGYVLSFSQAVAEECRGSGVTVTCVCPGATRTRFHERAGMEEIRILRYGWAQAADVARQSYRACMAGRRVVVTGANNKFSLALASLLPMGWRVKLAGSLIRD